MKRVAADRLRVMRLRAGAAAERVGESVAGFVEPKMGAGFERPAAVTLAEFAVDEWLPSKAERAAATRKQYEWAAERIVTGLGKAKLSALTARQIQAFHEGLRDEGLSRRSRQAISKTWRMALTDAVRRGYLMRNVSEAVTLPSGERQGEIVVWSRSEAMAFLAAVRDDRLFVVRALAWRRLCGGPS